MDHDHSFFDRRAETWEEDNPVPRRQLERVIAACRLDPGCAVLDVGTGAGRLIPFILREVGETGAVWALDPSEKMLEQAQKRHAGSRVHFVLGTAEKAALEPESFDRVVCYAVYPHFCDEDVALRRLARLLRPGGFLVVAHSEGRDAINCTHRHAGDEVAEDRLPPAKCVARRMRAAGLCVRETADDPDFYLVVGRRPGARGDG